MKCIRRSSAVQTAWKGPMIEPIMSRLTFSAILESASSCAAQYALEPSRPRSSLPQKIRRRPRRRGFPANASAMPSRPMQPDMLSYAPAESGLES